MTLLLGSSTTHEVASVAELKTLDIGATNFTSFYVKTRSYSADYLTTGGNAFGGATYEITTLAAYRFKIGKPSWTPDGVMDFTLNNGAIAINVSNNNFSSAAQMKLAVLDAGIIVKTESYYAYNSTTEAKGGAEYQIMTLAQWQTMTGFTTVDELVDHTLANGNVAKLVSDMVFVEMAGAKLDGVTDDSPSFNALSQAFEFTGGRIYIGPGTAIIDEQILVLGAIEWIGSGRNSTILKLADNATATGDNSGYMFDTFYRLNIRFQGITFDGNIANQSDYNPAIDNGASGVLVRNSEYVTFQDCYFKDWGKDGIWIFDVRASDSSISAATQANPCQITTSAAHGLVTGDWVEIVNVSGMTELNNKKYVITKVSDTAFTLDTVNSTGFTAYTSGGTVEPLSLCRDISIRDCFFENIYRFGVASISSAHVLVDGCFFWGGTHLPNSAFVANGGVTWEPDNANEEINGFTVVNSFFFNMASGIRMTNLLNAVTLKGVNISNNYLENIRLYSGIVVHKFGTNSALVHGNTLINCGSTTVAANLYELAGGVLFTGSDDITISNNNFTDCGGTEATLWSSEGGINAVITGNHFKNDRRSAMQLQTPTGALGNNGSRRIITNNTMLNGGQDAANTYQAIVLSNFAESQENGGDYVAGNVINTSTTNGYSVGIATFDDDGTSYYGRNMITGTGTDYVVSGGEFPIRESDVISSGANNTSGALVVSTTFFVELKGNTVHLSIPAILGTATNVASFTLGYTLPARFRPASNVLQPIIVFVGGSTQATMGCIEIESTGVINMYRSGDRTTGWGTAASTGTLRICTTFETI